MYAGIAAFFILAAIVAPVWGLSSSPDKGLNGKGKAEHLYLFEKDPGTWMIVEDGAWGKMTYLSDKGTFCFNGHNLTYGNHYALIYYPDPWPGTGLEVLGDGYADELGDIHIADTFDFGSIPIDGDTNSGAKIWLVLYEDQDGSQMIGWNPSEYLFEYVLINS